MVHTFQFPTCRSTPAPSAPWSDDFGLRAAPSDLHIYQAMDIRASGGNLQGQLEAPILVTDWRVPKDPKDQSFQWRNRATSEEIDEPNPSKGSQFAKPTTRVYCCGWHKKSEPPSHQPWLHPLRPSKWVDLVEDSGTGIVKVLWPSVVHLARYIQWTSTLKQCQGRRLIDVTYKALAFCPLFLNRCRQWKVRTFSLTTVSDNQIA